MKVVSRMLRICVIAMLLTFGGMLLLNTNQIGSASTYSTDVAIYISDASSSSNDTSGPEDDDDHDCSYH